MELKITILERHFESFLGIEAERKIKIEDSDLSNLFKGIKKINYKKLKKLHNIEEIEIIQSKTNNSMFCKRPYVKLTVRYFEKENFLHFVSSDVVEYSNAESLRYNVLKFLENK